MITSEEFKALADVLENDTCRQSSFSVIMKHPNFIVMKGLNYKIVPFLVEKLKTDPHWWVFLLLDEIIDDKPEIPEESRGVFSDITKIWLDYLTGNSDAYTQYAIQSAYKVYVNKPAFTIYKISPTYSMTVYNVDPLPTPGSRYIDEDGKTFILRGPVVKARKPIVLGLDDWDQGYSFNLYPENEYHMAGPKGKLIRIIPKDEIQQARNIILTQLTDECHMVGIHSVGMDDNGVLVYANKGAANIPNHVGYVPVTVIEMGNKS